MDAEWRLRWLLGTMKGKAKSEEIIHSMSLEAGGLVEIYALDTGYEDWRRAIEWMREAGLVTSFTYLDEEVPVQITSGMFEENEYSSFRMTVLIGHQVWTTNFYSSTEIDFQGDPRSIRSVEDLAQVVDFMEGLGRITRKRVVLVSETLDPARTKPYVSLDVPPEPSLGPA